MLVEKSSKEALEYYIKGKPVTALWIGEDGGMNAMPLSDILDRPENRFDIPVVAGMVAAGSQRLQIQDSITVPEEQGGIRAYSLRI